MPLLSCRAVTAHLIRTGAPEGRPAAGEDAAAVAAVGAWAARTGAALHLAFCGDCGRYDQQLRVLRRALAAFGPGSGGGSGGGGPTAAAGAVPAATRAALLAQFRAWRSQRPRDAGGR